MIGFIEEFRKFATRGNVIDLAVGIMLGAAFNKIVSALVDDLLMPPIGLMLGRVKFDNLFVSLTGREYKTLAEAKAAGAPTLNYGHFLNTVVEFVIVAFALFLLVRWVNRLTPKPEDRQQAKTSRECPYCTSNIAIKATRCPQCTSDVPPYQPA